MKTSYRTTTGRVPGVVAGGPRQRVGEGGEEEAQRPGDDHVVVEVHVEGDQHHRVADPFNKTHMQLVVQQYTSLTESSSVELTGMRLLITTPFQGQSRQ